MASACERKIAFHIQRHERLEVAQARPGCLRDIENCLSTRRGGFPEHKTG